MKEDELLHSFLFRNFQLFSLEQSYKRLISKYGGWQRYPKLTNDEASVFHQYDSRILFYLFIRNISPQFFKDSLFASPDSVYRYFKRIFYPSMAKKSWSKDISTPIMFCHECILDSIKENGYGYFKRDWLEVSQCEVHKTDLLILDQGNVKNTISDIQTILRGEIPEKAIRYTKSSFFYNSPVTFYPVKFSVCAALEIGNFIRENTYQLQKMYKEDEVFLLSQAGLLCDPELMTGYAKYNQEGLNFEYLFDDNYLEISDFIHSELQVISISMLNSSELVEPFLVSKHMACDCCGYSKTCCAANQCSSDNNFEVIDINTIDLFEVSSLLQSLKKSGYSAQRKMTSIFSPMTLSK